MGIKISKVDFGGKTPRVDESVFLAPSSCIIGDVSINKGSSVWLGAVIRGDDDSIRIGERTTVLENCVIEAPLGYPVEIGDGAMISHGAIVHGAKIGDRALIGIGAIVLDGADVGDGAVVASGAVVPPRFVIPSNKIAMGIPAKVIRDVKEGEREMFSKEHERSHSKALKYKKIFETWSR